MDSAIARFFPDSIFHGATRRRRTCTLPALLLLLLLAAAPLRAHEVNDQLSISSVAAAALQCQEIDGAVNGANRCRDGIPFQPEISYNAEGATSVFVKLGFAEGNGLNPASPFALAVWAADLEDDVNNINGRSRDHVLTAWARQRFRLGNGTTLAVTGGLIDTTGYLDDNAFANDEYGQFMNEAFVNAPTAFLPSYDWGGVVELDRGPWSLRAVTMRVGENDEGNGYSFYGGQIAYTANTRLGEGTYRLVAARTSDEFSDPSGNTLEGLQQFTFSADQQLGETFGVFARFSWQDDAASVTHDAMYSGGLTIKGSVWGRADDTIGIGYAHLNGGNGDVSRSHVTEIYYRAALNEHWALTGNVQLIEDELTTGPGPKGTIFSLRGTKEF